MNTVVIPAGRPRRMGVGRWSHYAGAVGPNTRPRCRAAGCKRFLKKDQSVSCSKECFEALKRQVERLSAGLEADEKERPW